MSENSSEEIFEALRKPFSYKHIKWRVGATTQDKTKGLALAYIDSRTVMDRLDEVLGETNWQDRYPFKGCCELSIRIGGEWITKSNCAGETKREKEKGEASDAFKRAATMFGVGRYLYNLDNKWYPLKKIDSRTWVLAANPDMPNWALPENEHKNYKMVLYEGALIQYGLLQLLLLEQKQLTLVERKSISSIDSMLKAGVETPDVVMNKIKKAIHYFNNKKVA